MKGKMRKRNRMKSEVEPLCFSFFDFTHPKNKRLQKEARV